MESYGCLTPTVPPKLRPLVGPFRRDAILLGAYTSEGHTPMAQPGSCTLCTLSISWIIDKDEHTHTYIYILYNSHV